MNMTSRPRAGQAVRPLFPRFPVRNSSGRADGQAPIEPKTGATGGINPLAQLQEGEWWNKSTGAAAAPEPLGSQYAPASAAPVGTAANPSPSTVNPARPNSGGTISTNLTAPPTAFGTAPEDRASDAMTSTGLTRTIAPEAAPAAPSQPVNPNVGTEKANPLTGAAPAAGTEQPRPNSGGTITTSIKTPAGPWGKAEDGATDTMTKTGLTRIIGADKGYDNTPNVSAAPDQGHAQSLGISQRGSSVPAGSDTLPGSSDVGSSGLFNRSFTNPKAGNIYASYVRGLFADGGIGA